MKKGIKVIFALILFVSFIVINFVVLDMPVQASVKSVACNAVGCPNGIRPCANVGAAPLVFFCYEPIRR